MTDRRLVRLSAQYLAARRESAEVADEMRDRMAVAEIVAVSSFAWWDRGTDTLTDEARDWCMGLRQRVLVDRLAELLETIVSTQAVGEAGVRAKLTVWRVLHDPDDADRLLSSIMADFRAPRSHQRRSA